MNSDVIVLGAGFSGLQAARSLLQAGLKVRVLEARDRPGGRIETIQHSSGAPLDLGGQWVGPQQKRIRALARELGVETVASHDLGDHVFCFRGRISRFSGTVPPLPGHRGAAVALALDQLDRLAATVNPRAPWRARNARQWDGMTVRSWINTHVEDPAARDVVALTLESVFACDPADLSLLHALFYVRAAGGVSPLLATEGGAQQDRLVGGAQQIADRLAARLGVVLYGKPVRRVDQSGTDVRVHGDDGQTWLAHRVILAAPPTLLLRLAFNPPLPGIRDQFLQRFPMSSVIKCFALYPTPWWRSLGFSGHAISDVGPVQAVFDASPPAGSPGILLGFFEGREAREFSRRGPKDRRRAFLQCLVRYFGPQARRPMDFVEKDWSEDPWTRGGYVGFLPPGVWTDFGSVWREPVGRIHFAGTETATQWHGYMEGALEAGDRAAQEVLRSLEKPSYPEVAGISTSGKV